MQFCISKSENNTTSPWLYFLSTSAISFFIFSVFALKPPQSIFIGNVEMHALRPLESKSSTMSIIFEQTKSSSPKKIKKSEEIINVFKI